ncbi:hypothetical protein JXA88_01715 [Candidatus Fermentibacteria bacterium]|nr:hypothetical protein [Candidatus Fermentibacteria bacterium]
MLSRSASATNRHLSVSLVLLVQIVLVILPAPVFADIPQVMSYQGKVTDSGGTPVTDGSYPMRFQIYTAETGGTQLWDSGPQTVTLSGGVFSVMLGAGTMPVLNLAFNQDYWLQVYFNYELQSPRQRLGSVGYAYMASGIVPGTEVCGAVSSGAMAVLSALNMAAAGTAHGLHGETSSGGSAGVYGTATATGGAPYGVFGRTLATDGMGVAGQAFSTAGVNYGVFGVSSSSQGTGVFGKAEAATGVTRGGWFETQSTNGMAVYGLSAATAGVNFGGVFEDNSPDGGGLFGANYATEGYTSGVWGRASSSNGRGVWGEALATHGDAIGVYGESFSGTGIGVYGRSWATTNLAYGVKGETASSEGIAVSGSATATTGTTYGVRASSSAESGRGVYGSAYAYSGVNYGGYFKTNSGDGIGVQGTCHGTTGTGYGVRGITHSANGAGVYGLAHHPTHTACGVYGENSSGSASAYGVYGYCSSTSSPYGQCGAYGCADGQAGCGVLGIAGNSSGTYPLYGVYGFVGRDTGTTYGIYGEVDSPDGYAVYGETNASVGTAVYGRAHGTNVDYGVYSYGNFAATGTKAAVVETADHGWVHLYTVESPDVLFEDVGSARLVNGEAVVAIDPVFTQTVSLHEPYQVFVTPQGDCGLYVALKNPDSFVVRALSGSASTIMFDYRIVAKRRGFERVRMARASAPVTPRENGQTGFDFSREALKPPAIARQSFSREEAIREEENLRPLDAHSRWALPHAVPDLHCRDRGNAALGHGSQTVTP